MSSSIENSERIFTDSSPSEHGLVSISVIVPVRNEEPHIAHILDQLLDLDREGLQVEIVVVDGRSTDRTREIVSDYAARHSIIRLCDNPHRLSSGARNVGIQQSRGEYILVIDGHCEIPTSKYLRHLADAFEHSGADCLGRPQPLFVTDPTALQTAIAVGRSSWLGHHPSSYVYSDQERDVPAISVAVAYRRSVFDEVGLFDERFDACEDCDLNFRLDKAGLKCRFVPQLAVTYKPRISLRGLFHQLSRYGRGRVRLARKHPATLSVPSCGPPLFAVMMLLGFIVCFAFPSLWLPFLSLLALSFSVVLGTSLWLALRRCDARLIFLLPVVFGIIHASYTYGFLQELVNPSEPRKARSLRARSG